MSCCDVTSVLAYFHLLRHKHKSALSIKLNVILVQIIILIANKLIKECHIIIDSKYPAFTVESPSQHTIKNRNQSDIVE